MAQVTFIGLGVMGYPMARHLAQRGGHAVTVYNRTAAKAAKWVAEYGGRHNGTPAHSPMPTSQIASDRAVAAWTGSLMIALATTVVTSPI